MSRTTQHKQENTQENREENREENKRLSPTSLPFSLASLPSMRGRVLPSADLSRRVWLKCGGPAAVLFEPADEEDLLSFVRAVRTVRTVRSLRYTALGAGSNVLIADKGLDGVVVALARFSHLRLLEDGTIEAGAGVGLGTLARFAAREGRDGLSFFVSIPGSVGGAVRMNAGAEGAETKDVLVEARVLDLRQQDPQNSRNLIVRTLACRTLGLRYRASAIEEGLIVTGARFRTKAGDKTQILEEMKRLREKRERAQPVREKTGGSTFKNPVEHKAWQLIADAGMRGARHGDAEVSQKHCNFLINRGQATASDFLSLGEEVRAAVLRTRGVCLEWEIARLGFEHDDLVAIPVPLEQRATRGADDA